MPRSANPSTARSSATKTSSPKPRAARATAKINAKAPALKKAEVKAMLLSAQKKLYDAETTLEAHSSELEILRAQTSEQQAELTQLRDGKYDSQVDVALAHHKRDAARDAAETAITEIHHLTQLLAASERVRTQVQPNETTLEAVQKQCDEAHARAETATAQAQQLTQLLKDAKTAHAQLQDDLMTTQTQQTDTSALDAMRKELEAMRAKVSAAEAAVQETPALRQRIAEQDDKLQSMTWEMTDLTELLEQTETKQHTDQRLLELNVTAGRAAVAALITPPGTDRMDADRLAIAAAAFAASGAFDAEWYLAINTDIAESGVDPVLHFLEYGFAEGRAPRSSE